MRSRPFRERRWLFALSALVLVGVFVAVASGSKGGRDAHNAGLGQQNAVKSDIDVSGPSLQNQTRDPHSPRATIRCGEPEITQDVNHPNRLFVGCTPESTLNYQTPQPAPYFQWSYTDPTMTNIASPCFLFRSDDGGNDWEQVKPNPLADSLGNLCADVMLARGPHGELYMAADRFHSPPNDPSLKTYVTPPLLPLPMQPTGIGFSRSLDGGKTWSKPTVIPTAIDGPAFTVDQSTGTLYEISSCANFDETGPNAGIGDFGCTPTARNLAVSTDRGQTWTPSPEVNTTNPPTTTITPGHLHNIAPLGGSREGIAAAQGVLGAIGATSTGLEFGYSTDNGATFTTQPLAMSPACASPQAQISADPTRRGTFAVIVLCQPAPHAVRIFVTHDLGTTWHETSDLAVVPPPEFNGTPSPFSINRPWLDYGPTGALGVMWRQAYGPTTAAFGLVQPVNERLLPQDVFAAISTDGGDSFGQPVRVNTAASPGGDPRQVAIDDLSGIHLDRKFAYVAWGDWRSGDMGIWFRTVPIATEKATAASSSTRRWYVLTRSGQVSATGRRPAVPRAPATQRRTRKAVLGDPDENG